MGGPGSERLAYVIVILLGVVAGLLWLLLQEADVGVGEGPPGIEGAAAADPEAPLIADAEVGALEGRGMGEGSEPEALPAPTSTAPPATHVVRGTVRDATGQPLEMGWFDQGIAVRALREYGWLDAEIPAVFGRADEAGRYELDVSSVFERDEPPTQLRVDFDHRAHMPTSRKLIVEDGRRPAADGPIVFHVDVQLQPAVVLRGVVHDVAAEPVAEARVYLLRPTEAGFAVNAVGEALALDQADSGIDGAFRLRAPAVGRYYVAALAEGYLPEGVPLDVAASEDRARIELALRRGRTIAGRVQLNGRPLPDVRVHAEQRPQTKPSYQLELDWVHLRDGRLHPGKSSATTDKAGRFEIKGLDAGERRVAPGWSGGMRVWPTLLQAAAQTVEAGREDLVLEVGGVEVEVRPVSGGVLVADADVTIAVNDNEKVRSRTADAHAASFVLPPERTFELQIRHPGFQPVVRELRTGPLGVPVLETVDLGPAKPEAVLVLRLRDDAGVPIPRADIQVVDRDAPLSFGFDMEPVKRSADGVYRIEHLEPGHRSVVVRPGRSSMEFFGYFLVRREDVHLAAAEETQLDIVARRGGRLRIAVRDAEGTIRGCKASLRNARGQIQRVAYVSGGDDFATMSTSGPGAASPSTVAPPLEPGEYELELSLDGYLPQRVKATIEIGETTDVEVTLRKL